uniref:Phosphatidylethanolamine N-methyltransferase n=1 Tax=Gadus morhua TaxID=8049 RepID=A0A8C5CHB4_GADMO
MAMRRPTRAPVCLQVDMSLLGEVVRHVDVSDPRFCVAVLAVLFNPFFWNVVARWEHRTRGLSRLFRSPSLACYCLGVLIILLNVYRSHSMAVVMKAQPRWELLDRVEVFYAGAVLMAAGGLLVLTSFLSLGFTGTFLGGSRTHAPTHAHTHANSTNTYTCMHTHHAHKCTLARKHTQTHACININPHIVHNPEHEMHAHARTPTATYTRTPGHKSSQTTHKHKDIPSFTYPTLCNRFKPLS